MNTLKSIKKLTWMDFKGIPDGKSCYDACLNWGIYYNYTYQPDPKKLEIAKINMQVSCRALETSWYKRGKETEELLIHELGHLIIAHVFANKIRDKVLNSCIHLKSVDEKIKKIFEDLFEECVNYQNLYDDDTNHSLNNMLQQKWNEHLQLQMSTYGLSLL
jgi:hypothetical protein